MSNGPDRDYDRQFEAGSEIDEIQLLNYQLWPT